MATKDTSKKPILWGTATTDTEAVAGIEGTFLYEERDPSYVPGHGEIVMANDIAKGDLPESEKQKYYARFGASPQQLPADLCWVRTTGINGARSYTADVSAAEYRRLGYRPCKVEDLESLGWGIPPTAHVEADGTIRREDTALWIIDGARARALEQYRARVNAEFHAVRGKNADDGTPISVKQETRETLSF